MTNVAHFPLLSLILFLPLVGAALLLFVPKDNGNAIRWIANIFALGGFLVSLPLWFWYNPQDAQFQFVERIPWIPSVGAEYFLGVDGFSTLMVLLATLFGFIAILSSWTAITERVKEYYIFLLILQTGMVGAFVSLDFLLFFLFWEVMLVPMYFLIGIWGSDRRLYSAIKFFLYTLVGSVIMLLGILACKLYNYSVTHALVRRHRVPADERPVQPAVVGVSGVLPRLRGESADVPVPHVAARRAHGRAHRRLGDSGGCHAEDGDVRLPPVLAADPAGCHAALRADDGHAVDHRHRLRCAVRDGAAGLEAARGLLERQPHGDGHARMFALNPLGITGSIVQQISHGISTGALFLIVGIVYERRHTRQISEYGGLSKVMPVYATIFLIMTMSSIGLPALNGFIGELLILQGVFVANKMWAAFAASGVVLGAAYMLWLYQRTMFGKIENPKNEHLRDLNFREFATFAPLLILAVWIGLYPAPFIRRLETSVNRVVARVSPEYRAPAVNAQAVAPAPAPVASRGQN